MKQLGPCGTQYCIKLAPSLASRPTAETLATHIPTRKSQQNPLHEYHVSAHNAAQTVDLQCIPCAPPYAKPERNLHRRELLIHAAALFSLTTAADCGLHAGPVQAALVDEDVATAVLSSSLPSVASIAVLRTIGGVRVRELIGSGTVWDTAGPHVVTNFHILPPLQGTSTLLQVTLQDAATGAPITLGARVEGTDSLHDLAVLRLLPLPADGEDGSNTAAGPVKLVAAEEIGPSDSGDGGKQGALPRVRPIRVGSSGDLKVGQSVFALGCLASDSGSASPVVSAGLVSGLERSIPSPVGARIYGVIQTDAVINAATSGGPLMDSSGRLVGINTAVGAAAAGMGRGSGVGFALPVDLLRDLVPKIIVYGNPYGKK